ncbi:MAG: hypothetical protein B6244_10370 [Candidatus Cloacimonetes bacterium 4572_55]|nr:MAG: hypothetical protein B6244_10370 [Candidatus Cloacimonetes bacterium 4572_55]
MRSSVFLFIRQAMLYFLIGGFLCSSSAFTNEIIQSESEISIVELSKFREGMGQVRDINDHAQVVGFIFSSDKNFRSFLCDQDSVREIIDPEKRNAKAYAINNAGDVTGSMFDRSGRKAYLWSADKGMVEIGSLGGESCALSVNDHGRAVGYSYVKSNQFYHGFFWDGEQMTDLGTLGGRHSTANDISNNGRVVGQAMKSDNQRRAFTWSAEQGMTELASPPNTTTSGALSVNDLDQTVGFAVNQFGSVRAYLWQDAETVDLGALGGETSMAVSINNSGLVVGYSRTSDDRQHAFLWENGRMIDLNDLLPTDSGWELTEARSINDTHRIVGLGTYNDVETSFVLDISSMLTAKH